MKISMYHNPKCSKSREALGLLNEKGIHPDIILYLKTPPSQKELSALLKKLGISAKELIRFKEEIAKELGIHPTDERSEEEWIKLMAEHPVLIERPIVITPHKAVIGRPPERVLALIGEK